MQDTTSFWTPQGVPSGARVFQLETNEKRPTEGDVGAHKNARPLSSATLVPGPGASYGISLNAADGSSMWLLVDQDKESEAAARFVEQLPVTWSCSTNRAAASDSLS